MSLPRSLSTFRRAAARGLVAVLAASALVACGGDDSDDARSEDETTTTTTGDRPGAGAEDTTTTAGDGPAATSPPTEEVLATLPKLRDLGNEAAVAAGKGDWKTAAAKHAELEKLWDTVEAAVEDADRDAHESIETAHDLIKDGAESETLDRVTQGAEAQRLAIDAFLEANG